MHEHVIEHCTECDAVITTCRCNGVRPKHVSTRLCIGCQYEEDQAKAMRVEQTREWLDMDD